jgi:hypothetical protein
VAAASHVGQVGGCIKRCADRWARAFPYTGNGPHRLSKPADVAANGVRLKLVKHTPPMMASGKFPQAAPKDNNQAAIIEQAVLLMHLQGVIEPVPPPTPGATQHQLYHSLFLRPKKERPVPHGGSMTTAVELNCAASIRSILKAWRLIINYKLGINRYGVAQKFQGTTTRHGIQLLRTRDFMVYADVEEAYYNVPLHESCSILCGFWILLPQLRQLAPWGWRLLTLGFGLWSAPRDFVKQLKTCLGLCRKWGIRLSDLMDDVLLAASTTDQCLQHAMVMIMTLTFFGWRVKMEKLALIPSQVREYGGKVLMTSPYITIDTPHAKWMKQLGVLRTFRSEVIAAGMKVTMRQLAAAYGICASNSDSLFGCRVWSVETCAHYGRLQSAKSPWDHPQSCPSAVIKEWTKWLHPVFARWRGVRIDYTPPTLLIAGDSSGTMIGGKGLLSSVVDRHGRLKEDPRCPPITAFHPLTFNGVRIRHQHSSKTELFGALLLIVTYVLMNNLSDVHVKYLGDNTTAKAYINRMGGRKTAHCRILRPFLDLLRLRRIKITMGYRSGLTMIRWGVDGLSRVTGTMNDAELTPQARAWLFPLLHPLPTLDLFAAMHNKQLPTYWARYPSLEAERADALTQSWTQLPAASWAFPPCTLVAKAIQKMKETTGQTVHFLVPASEQQSWWPELLNSLVDWPVLVPVTSWSLAHPCYESSGLRKPRWLRKGWYMWAATLSRCASKRADFLRQLQKLSTVAGRRQQLRAMMQHSPSTLDMRTAERSRYCSLLTSLSLSTSRR